MGLHHSVESIDENTRQHKIVIIVDTDNREDVVNIQALASIALIGTLQRLPEIRIPQPEEFNNRRNHFGVPAKEHEKDRLYQRDPQLFLNEKRGKLQKKKMQKNNSAIHQPRQNGYSYKQSNSLRK